ncbi:hypothetical protein [Ralstonia insidiosa]|uniref:Uncharacterized protein n=1 Tax=Ralstonia insidiosa TaxID=190721 RepID=A0A848NWT0_9RALS|nr:hypothetical protein [Ralstonia insidiosa]NMV36946.1 hypothetical protein [Ralstonia insidiosa]
MQSKKKMLKLVTEPNHSRAVDPASCASCEAKRQLEHVKMCLNAALLAANKPLDQKKGGS